MSSSSDESESESYQKTSISPVFSIISNAVLVSRVSTERNEKKTQNNDAETSGLGWQAANPKIKHLSAFSASITEKVIKFHVVPPEFNMIVLEWSVSYCNQKVFESKTIETDWCRSKKIEFSIADVALHPFYDSFELKFNYEKEGDVDAVFTGHFKIEVKFFERKDEFYFSFLDHFRPDPDLVSIFKNNYKMSDSLSESQKTLLEGITNYCRTPATSRPYSSTVKMLQHAQTFEDLESHKELLGLEQRNVEIVVEDFEDYSLQNRKQRRFLESKPSRCVMKLSRVSTNLLKSLALDEISMFIQFSGSKKGTVPGIIKNVGEDNLTFIARHNFIKRKPVTELVFFEYNRSTTRASLKGLSKVTKSERLLKFLADFDASSMPLREFDDVKFGDEDFKWKNPQLENNIEQQTAIKKIVNRTAYPLPYVIFGPPGTGKTSTLVECIIQISMLRPLSRILVTTQSNSACEEIGTRLLKAVPLNKILRLYSPSMDKEKLDLMNPKLRTSSNKRGENEEFPTKQQFHVFQIVIVTLMSSNRLAQSCLDKKYFDYIFLDECAAASEPESLVPILGLGTRKGKITANVVILGDHKQLGANVKSDMAESIGLGISFMERIMSKDLYKITDNGYDTNIITQLLNNYRCHPAVLQFSNVAFYENILRAKVNDELRNFAVNWELLPNKDFPVLMHCVKAPSHVEHRGTSSFNMKEIEVVKSYVDKLLKNGINTKNIREADIGIVTPYVSQLRKLRSVFNRIEVGTAEYFQGREKKIIIVSTVKSCTNVGFLKNEKRLNVILTRAQSLMIVVGNAETLQRDNLWRLFVHYCFRNNACVGESFNLGPLEPEEEKSVDQMCEMFKKKEKSEVTVARFKMQFTNFQNSKLRLMIKTPPSELK